MVFSEIYGTYFQVVAEILELASREPVSEKKVREIVEEKAFAESILTIPATGGGRSWTEPESHCLNMPLPCR